MIKTLSRHPIQGSRAGVEGGNHGARGKTPRQLPGTYVRSTSTANTAVSNGALESQCHTTAFYMSLTAFVKTALFSLFYYDDGLFECTQCA
jgi:hypothetical protein